MGKSESELSGWECIFTKQQVATSTFESARSASRGAGRLDSRRGFAPIVLRTKAGNLALISAHLMLGLGMRVRTRGALVALGAFAQATANPWPVLADWNIEPEPLRSSGWPARFGAATATPNCRATGVAGPERARGCSLTSSGCPEVSPRPEFRAPWKSHCGVAVSVKTAREQRWRRHLAAARDLPAWERPRALDPESKRSKKREAACLRRQQALPEGMLEALVAESKCQVDMMHGRWASVLGLAAQLHWPCSGWILRAPGGSEVAPPAKAILDAGAALPENPAERAKGAAAFSPARAQRQSCAARQQLVDILNAVEAAGARPSRSRAASGAGAPEELGDNRAAGAAPTPRGARSKTRPKASGERPSSTSAIRDTAIAGSSALRAALARAAMGAGAGEFAFDHVAVISGLTKLHDSVIFVSPMQTALEIGPPLPSSRSAPARQLDGAHRAPPAGRWSYVDNILRGAEGAGRRVILDPSATAGVMAARLGRLLFRISGKTQLVASSGEIGAMRRDAVAGAAGAKRGRCSAPALPAARGASGPDVGPRRRLLKERVALWPAQPALRPRIAKAWPRARTKLRRGSAVRRRGVRGRIAALQATFHEAGRGPLSVTVWIRPLARGAIDDGISPTFGDDQFDAVVLAHFEDVLGACAGDCVALQWQQAARRVTGEDLSGGGDMATARVELSRLVKRAGLDERAVDLAAIFGGHWARDRPAGASDARERFEAFAREARAGSTRMHSKHRFDMMSQHGPVFCKGSGLTAATDGTQSASVVAMSMGAGSDSVDAQEVPAPGGAEAAAVLAAAPSRMQDRRHQSSSLTGALRVAVSASIAPYAAPPEPAGYKRARSRAPGNGGGSEAEELEVKQLQEHYEWQIQRQDEDMRALQRRMGKLEQRRAELKENWDRERNGLVRELSRYAAVLTRYAIPLEEACDQDGVHEQALQPQLQQAPPQQPQQPPQPQAQKQQGAWAAAPASAVQPAATSSLDAKMKRLNGLLSDGPARKGAAEQGADTRRDAAGGASQGGAAAARGGLTAAKEGSAAAQGSGDGVLGGSTIASTLQAMFPHATVRTQPEGSAKDDADPAEEGKAGAGAAARGGDAASDDEPRKKEGGAFADADVVALAEELEATTESQIDDRALRALQSLPPGDAMEVLQKVEDLVNAQGGKCRNLSSILQSVCRKLERKAAGRRDPAAAGVSVGDADDGAAPGGSLRGERERRGAEGVAAEVHGRAHGDELGSDAEAREERADGSGGSSAEEGGGGGHERRRRERASDDEESEEGGKEATDGCYWTRGGVSSRGPG
ncbi:unnamed protein product, partial [Prorocentrum cordatum]